MQLIEGKSAVARSIMQEVYRGALTLAAKYTKTWIKGVHSERLLRKYFYKINIYHKNIYKIDKL